MLRAIDNTRWHNLPYTGVWMYMYLSVCVMCIRYHTMSCYQQVLNEFFHNVCELDLVFNFYKVYSVVDEMFLAGEIRETSQSKVLQQLQYLNTLD